MRRIGVTAFLFGIVFFANNSMAHWSGIDLCDDIDGINYTAAKKILHEKKWKPDIPKKPSHSLHPELSCVRGVGTPCEVTFRKGNGFIILDVIENASDEFWVEKCY